nr:protein sat1 [Quercus suber]
MTPPPKSNVRAFVHWREPAVYAGEQIECVITFKNIAPAQRKEAPEQVDGSTPLPRQEEDGRNGGFSFDPRKSSTATGSKQGAPGPVPQSRRASIVQAASRTPSIPSTRAVSGRGRGHRPTLSLNVVSATSKTGLRSAPLPQGRFNPTQSTVQPTRGHGRSLSIMSLGSDVRSDGKIASSSTNGGEPGKRLNRRHSRSASLQYIARPSVQQTQTASSSGIGARQPSPLYKSTTPPATAEQSGTLPVRPGRRRPGTMSANNTPQLGRQMSVGDTSQLGVFHEDFEFPRKAHSPDPSESRPRPLRVSSAAIPNHGREHPPRSLLEGGSASISSLNPISRVMSESSLSGTPRTSSDLFSMSNHSDDTLTSELPTQQNETITHNQPHLNKSARSASGHQTTVSAEPETLMMGYVQTMGHFTLDGSLINAAPFEEVKRKGVQSGGGVVGVERPKRASGMFGALSWSNIGESLGGILGGDEMSSIAQMKATAGSKNIPLLSTPQSLLFVDLKLGPGESKSYSYQVALPRGLPPTYRGKAIKVQYHLAIGVQRPGAQSVKHAKAPFRILGSYDSQGQSLGHDLMSPYIMLQDTAKTASILVPISAPIMFAKSMTKRPEHKADSPSQGLEDFLRYTERLLEQSVDTNAALLSPSSPVPHSMSDSRRQSTVSLHGAALMDTQETISQAILRSNRTKNPLVTTPQQETQISGNRFNITRSNQPVAVLTILRPAYRLGEAIIGTIDFTAAPSSSEDPVQVPVYAVVVELETEEVVDPSLSLRSSHSIYRVTRCVHASTRENAIFARTVSFNLSIPAHAAPGFETTGVSLQWNLKVEFSVQRPAAQGLGIENSEAGGQALAGGLLEAYGTDDRGTAFIARERMVAEIFDIKIPIKVYGARAGTEGINGLSESLEV